MKRNLIGRDRTNKVNLLVLNVLVVSVITCGSVVAFATGRSEMAVGIFLLIHLIPLFHWWLYKYIQKPDHVRWGHQVIYITYLMLLFLAGHMFMQRELHPEYISFLLLLCCLIIQNHILTPRQKNDEVEKPEKASKTKFR